MHSTCTKSCKAWIASADSCVAIPMVPLAYLYLLLTCVYFCRESFLRRIGIAVSSRFRVMNNNMSIGTCCNLIAGACPWRRMACCCRGTVASTIGSSKLFQVPPKARPCRVVEWTTPPLVHPRSPPSPANCPVALPSKRRLHPDCQFSRFSPVSAGSRPLCTVTQTLLNSRPA